MNKVFKVIWNHATQTWTAVSELGHAKGKTKSKKIVKLTALAGAVIGSLTASQSAMAATDLRTNDAVNIAADNVPNPTAGRHAVAVGGNANAAKQDSIAIGTNSKASWTNTIAIGRDTNATQDHAVAIGSNTTASGVQAVTVGSYSNATANSVVAIGQESKAGGTGAGTAAVAVGYLANASAANTVAAGKSASASVDNAVALGVSSQASARNAAALGAYSNASGERAAAVGAVSKATGEASFAAGTGANASGKNAVAIGGSMEDAETAKAQGESAIAIGTNSTAAAAHSTSIGTASKASATQSIALGSIAEAQKDGSVAVGYNSTAAQKNSMALGFNAQSNHESSVALGAGSVTGDKAPFANLEVAGKNYNFAGTKLDGVVSIGTKDKERQIPNVGAGRISPTSTDAVNGSQLYAVADAVSNHHWVVGGNTTAKNTAAPTVSDEFEVKNKDIVEFQNGNGTKATIEYTKASQSSGTPAKTVVKYHANIVDGDNTKVVYNANGTVQINAKVAGGTDTTAAVTTTTTDALSVTNTTTGNVTTYNVDAKTGAISTTTVGAATYEKDGDKKDGGNYGARLTNVSTVTDIVNNVSWHLNSSPVTGTNGKITEGSDKEAADVKASNTVNINAGKNIEIKRNGTTIEISSTAAGEKGDTGATGAKGEKGGSITGEVVDNGDGTHTITITDLETGSVTTTIVKDGKNGKDGKDGATGAKGDTGATGAKGEKGDTGAAGAKGDTGAKGEKGDTGATGAKGEKGDTGATGAKGEKGDTGEKGGSITGEVVDNGDGTHTITITDLETGSVTTTIVKDGKDGKDGVDGKNAKADVKDNGDGTHTVTITDGEGNTTTTIVKDGKNAEADVKDNGDGTHTVTIKDGNGNTTTTIVKDGKNAEAEVKDNGNGTHTVTIKDGNGNTTTTIVKDGAKGEKGDTGADGKNAEAEVKDNGNGTHTVTIKDGNGNTTTTIVKDGAKGEKGDKGADGVMTWDIKSTGNKAEGSEEAAKTIKHTNTVDMAAGKNLTVKQTSNENGAKVEFALNSNVTNLDKVVVNGKDGKDGENGVTITAPGGKDGKDGLDGKVGISGKDGKDAVSISGKDGVGQIGLTGPKGKDGKDGASINITTDNGKQTLVNREVGADGKPGETTQRIIYVPTDKDGNPLKDENGNTIKREVATMDDGLVFGGNTGEAHKAALGTQVNVKGADANTDWNKFDAGQNIMTKVDGNTITVGLAKDLDVDNVTVANNVTAKGTISAPTIKAGDTTIKNGVVTNLTHHIDNPTTVVDNKVLNITDEKKKEAATVRDVLNSGWNLQANGKPVDAVTHGNNVNFASDKGTVTVKANSDGKTSVVNLDVNVDNDTITVNNKGQLVANGATNFNVATKDGGNKVAKKGGSSTTKITSGKTITYTAGKNIAIEQNGGDILVSTTNDVNHNSVTTNDLTVNKGGNIDMGGNQIHNVKAGTKDTDAVNVSQLKQSIGDVHKRINKVGKEARGGIAGANAAAGLPQVYIPGKSMVAASAGTFKGESAVAVGYSRSSDNGKVIFKLQGNANTQGDVGGSVGVGYQW